MKAPRAGRSMFDLRSAFPFCGCQFSVVFSADVTFGDPSVFGTLYFTFVCSAASAHGDDVC